MSNAPIVSKDAWTADRKYSTGQLLGYAGARRRSSRLRQLNSENRLRGALLLSGLFWYTLFAWYLPSSGTSTPLRQAYSRYTAFVSRLAGEDSSLAILGVDDAVVLVSAKQPGGYTSVKLPAPFDAELLHVVTSIHPRKRINATQDYQATSLLHLKAGEPTDLTFFCNFGNVRYPAEITALQQFPLVAASTLTVECALPPWFRSLQPGVSLEARRELLQKLIRGSYAFTLEWQSRSSPSVESRFPIRSWTTPKTEGTVSACTVPISLNDSLTAADLIEWRVHHLLQGVETVHWYSRDARLERWIKILSGHLGVQDSFNYAPDIAASDSNHHSAANDDLWYQDCLLRRSFHDDWLVRLSVKQYLQNEGTSSIENHLEKQAADIASFEVPRVYVGGDRSEAAPRLDGYPSFPRIALSARITDNDSGPLVFRVRGTVSFAASGGAQLVEGFKRLDHREVHGEIIGSMKVLESGKILDEKDYDKAESFSRKAIDLWQEEAKYLKALRKLLELPLA